MSAVVIGVVPGAAAARRCAARSDAVATASQMLATAAMPTRAANARLSAPDRPRLVVIQDPT
jgi:hypothetical protein